VVPESFSLDLDTVLNRKYPGTTHIDPKRTALIVVDMQRFFLEPGQPAYLPGGDGAPSAEMVVENSLQGRQALLRKYGIGDLVQVGPQGRRMGCRSVGAEVADLAGRNAAGPVGEPATRSWTS
jgi:hypothetical protein